MEIHQLALNVSRVAVRTAPSPRAVLPQNPGVGVVRETAFQDVEELLADAGVLDRRDQLDSVVEGSRHQIGGAREHALLFARALEGVDPRVLEEAPHNRDDLDVVRDAGYARPQGADPAHVQLYLHTGL